MKSYFEITKMDDEQQIAWGYASTEAVDAHGEIVTKAAMQGAWDDYMKYGNVREMHQPSAVGIVNEYNFDDTGVMIAAKIVDPTAWTKVKEGVYKGFSIGGSKVPSGYDPVTKTINALKLTEISLVDRPANPEAQITMWKMEDEPVSVEKLLTAENLDAILKFVGEQGYDVVVRPLQKGFAKLRAAVNTDDIQKSFYEVSDLAYLIHSLKWLYEDLTWDGDAAESAKKIREGLMALVDGLVMLIDEERSELLTKSEDSFQTLFSIIPEKVEKMAIEETIQKVEAEKADLQKQIDAMREEITQLAKASDEWKKRFEDMPVPPKGVVTPVEKSAPPAEPVVAPILKADGTVDEAATMIKKIHSAPGIQI